MSDFGREFTRPARPVEERLPWLDPVDDEPEARSGATTGKVVLLIVATLLVLGLVVAGVYWSRRPAALAGTGGAPGLIRAPEGDYKVRPDDPGGMDVEGQGDASYAASAGDDPAARLDLGAVPEEPVRRPGERSAARPAAAPTAAPQPASTEAAPAEPAPVAAGGGAVQLGALPSNKAANDAWKALSGRFAVLQSFTPAITPVEVNGRTLYRLRVPTASVLQARALCARLKVAGEGCIVVD